MTEEIRTRFAPSPTGQMHIGNLRTALYAYLFAKKNQGKFILRIEDTDQKRQVSGAVEIIYQTLKIAKIFHDEGPDIGGAYGPYVQSDRQGIYLQHVNHLVEIGQAYYCFCDKKRLDQVKERQKTQNLPIKYDGFCRNLSSEEVNSRLSKGEKYVIRQKISTTGSTSFHDEVYGEVIVKNQELDDNILLKADGFPTYNFAHVIDDHLMKITHVIRGSEYVSSTPKYVLLYQAFGWDLPVYIHLPPIIKSGGKKLSKRSGDMSFFDLLKNGYLPESIINYIAFLGWNPKNEREIFSLAELEKEFDHHNLHKSPAVFDLEKLKWYNGQYLRKLTLTEFHQLAMSYYQKFLDYKKVDLLKISKILHGRVEVLSDILSLIAFLENLIDYDINLFVNKKMKTDLLLSKKVLENTLSWANDLTDWNEENIKQHFLTQVQTMNLKNGQVLWPVRVALSGQEFTPGGAIEIADILGQKESLRRISLAIKKLN